MKNSLKYAKLLEDAGLPRRQAEMHVQIISDSLGDEVATKNELSSLESKIGQVESRLMTQIKDVKHEMQKIEYRITLRLGALMVVVPTVVKILLG